MYAQVADLQVEKEVFLTEVTAYSVWSLSPSPIWTWLSAAAALSLPCIDQDLASAALLKIVFQYLLSNSLMLCSFSALPDALSSSSSVPWSEHTPHRRGPRPYLQPEIQTGARTFFEQSASVSTGTCALWHSKTIPALSPCGSAQSWAAMAGPCVPLLNNCSHSGCVYPLSLSSSVQPMAANSSLHMRQSPWELAAEPAVLSKLSSNHKQQHQQPPRYRA